MKLLILFFLGASIGSFLGLVIDRFPHQSIIFPASHCGSCKYRLKPWELIPIVSQLLSGSKCRHCGITFPLWYACLEGATGCLVVLTALGTFSIGTCLFLLCGLTLSIYDIKHREYPLLVWLLFSLALLPFATPSPLSLVFLLLAVISYRWNIRMGSGDFLYLASAATLLSFQQTLWLIQISSLLGIAAFLLFKPKQPLPFIPYIFCGFFIVQFIF